MSEKHARHHLRFHEPHVHLAPVFGGDWFGLKAEQFARFFGTPVFLIGQSLLVTVWIILNATGVVTFDLYPFILLNLAFSLQAAYAAPLILLAQTRQADRDKALSDADAQHREALATAAAEQQAQALAHSRQLLTLMEQNTALTQATKDLTQHIETLTAELHRHLLKQREGKTP